MCLVQVEDNKPRPFEEGEGWKVVAMLRYRGKLTTDHYAGPFVHSKFQFDIWESAVQQPVGDAPYPGYISGFHIFKTEDDATLFLKETFGYNAGKRMAVVKVKYKGFLASGKTFVKINDVQSMDAWLPTLVVAQICAEKPIQKAA